MASMAMKESSLVDKQLLSAQEALASASFLDRHFDTAEHKRLTSQLSSAERNKDLYEQAPTYIRKDEMERVSVMLDEYVTGIREPNAREMLRLRTQVERNHQFYGRGSIVMSSPSEDELAYIQEQRLRLSNMIAHGYLGPVFGAPGNLKRMTGASDTEIAAGYEMGNLALNSARKWNWRKQRALAEWQSI